MNQKKLKVENLAEIRAESVSKKGMLLGYCAERNEIKGIAILDGKYECKAFISLKSIQNKIETSPLIKV